MLLGLLPLFTTARAAVTPDAAKTRGPVFLGQWSAAPVSSKAAAAILRKTRDVSGWQVHIQTKLLDFCLFHPRGTQGADPEMFALLAKLRGVRAAR